MSSPSNDPTDDQSGRFVRQPNGRVRPLSPHLQVWRFHPAMLGSITHRITGAALYFGMLVIAAWVLCLAMGPEAYGAFTAISSSAFGLLVWFGLTLCLIYHLLAGVRHLTWDLGHGLTPKSANSMAWVSLIGAPVLTLLLWAALFASGKVSL